KNIIKSQLYQLRKESLVWIVFVGLLLMPLGNIFLQGELTLEGNYPTQAMLAENGAFFTLMPLMFLFTLVGFVCCGDFIDKTSNYELMTGHKRIEVYFGRVIPCLIVGVIGFAVMTALPLIVNTAMHGWGTKLDVGEIVLRYTLLIFPAVRILCTAIFIAFIAKNPYALMIVGYFAFMLGGVGATMLKLGESPILGITNMNMLCIFDSWATYGLEGNMNYIYDASLSAGEITGTIVVSIIASAVFLYLGYVFFHKDDLN
ncbi:MAG: ABC transporter permease subunit, partial [Oscillospiraceae bacterium]|nr:ABC transporter permease subunit [Oscillospiraceae bacterium]